MEANLEVENLVADPPLAATAQGDPDDSSQAPRPASQAHTAESSVAAVDLALFTVAFGLFTGLIESGFWFFKRDVLGELIHLSQSVYWMAPVAALGIVLVPGLFLSVLARRLRHPAWLAFSVTLVSYLGWLNVVFLYQRIHFYACVLLTAGLAAATGRLFDYFGDGSRRVVRWAAPLLALGVALLAAGSEVGRLHRENRALAAGVSPERSRPNVLLIVLDTVRADALGMYGAAPSLSPALDRWSQRGVVFATATSTAPWTLPSHAGFFTSRLPHELTGDWSTPLDDANPTLAEWLGRHGYATAGFVANTRYCSVETGLARGFNRYEDFGYSAADFALSTAIGRRVLLGNVPTRLGLVDWPGRKSAAEINASMLGWLSRRGDRPFFAFVNYWDAHDPYVPQPPFDEHFAPTFEQRAMLRNWWWIDKQKLTPEQVAFARAAYDDCVRSLDHHVGRLFDALAERGELDDTLVIVTSDHGEHFGEHGLFTHGNSLYQPVLHVPLVIAWPGRVPAATRVAGPVSLRDLPATVCELAGVGEGNPFLGSSLSRWWRAKAEHAEVDAAIVSEIATPAKFPPDHGRSPVAGGALSSIIADGMKYIRSAAGAEELYDLNRDPQELEDLAAREAAPSTLDRLRARLREAVDQRAEQN